MQFSEKLNKKFCVYFIGSNLLFIHENRSDLIHEDLVTKDSVSWFDTEEEASIIAKEFLINEKYLTESQYFNLMSESEFEKYMNKIDDKKKRRIDRNKERLRLFN